VILNLIANPLTPTLAVGFGDLGMSKKQITAWELINPSDKITFTGDDFKLVVIAVCLVGNGFYAGEEINGSRVAPVFIFGGCDEWFIKNFGSNFEDNFNSSDKEKLANILDSFLVADWQEHQEFTETAKELSINEWKAFRTVYCTDKRSSINNICAKAWLIAEHLRSQNNASTN